MKKLQPRKVYETETQVYFGWDFRGSDDWGCVLWKRSPRLSPLEIQHSPFRYDDPADMKPDFCIAVKGDPSDDLLTKWLREEEKGLELTCIN